jgi:WD40 repeat protein
MKPLHSMALLVCGGFLLCHAARAAEPDQPDNAARTDRYGDPLPDGVLARLGTVRLRHGDDVGGAVFTPDGTKLVSWFFPEFSFVPRFTPAPPLPLCLWEPVSGRALRRFGDGGNAVLAAAIFPDGRSIVTADADHRLRLWEVATGKRLREFAGHTEWVNGVAVSRDGKSLASTSGDGTVRIWDAATAKELRQFAARDVFLTIAFSADGKSVAWESRHAVKDRPTCHEIRVSDLATGKDVCRLSLLDLIEVQLSPDARFVAAYGMDKVVTLWDLASGKRLHRWPALDRELPAFRFARDGAYLAVSDKDDHVIVWDCARGKQLSRCLAPGKLLTISPDGKTLVTLGGSLQLWDAATGKERLTFDGHTSPADLLVFTQDGRSLVSRSRLHGSLLTWDLARARVIASSGMLFGSEGRSAISPDGIVLAEAGGQKHNGERPVDLYNTATGKDIRELPGRKSPVEALAFSADGKKLACGTADGLVRVWVLATGKELCAFPQRKGGRGVHSLAFSPDDKVLICAEDRGHVRHLNIDTGAVLKDVATWAEGDEPSEGLTWPTFPLSSGGQLLARARDGKLYLMDTTTGREYGRLEKPDSGVFHIAISPDGRFVLDAWRNIIRVWEVASGQQVRRFDAPYGIWAAAFAPDGRTIATSTSGDFAILIWDLTGLATAKAATREPNADRVNDWWTDLAGDDAVRAHRAIWSLAASPRFVPFLKEKLRPASPIDGRRLAPLIAALDDHVFAAREKATRELAALGDAAEAGLERALKGQMSPEARDRAEKLLRACRPPLPPGEPLRSLRAMAALEHAGTREARQLLEAFAKGEPEARLTREARAALERLASQPAA